MDYYYYYYYYCCCCCCYSFPILHRGISLGKQNKFVKGEKREGKKWQKASGSK